MADYAKWYFRENQPFADGCIWNLSVVIRPCSLRRTLLSENCNFSGIVFWWRNDNNRKIYISFSFFFFVDEFFVTIPLPCSGRSGLPYKVWLFWLMLVSARWTCLQFFSEKSHWIRLFFIYNLCNHLYN